MNRPESYLRFVNHNKIQKPERFFINNVSRLVVMKSEILSV